MESTCKNMEFLKQKKEILFLRKYIKVPWKTHGIYMAFLREKHGISKIKKDNPFF
jgi:hypothetical protein